MEQEILYDKKISLMLWKISNIWQIILRRELKKFSLTLNEYIILETLFLLKNTNITTQTNLSKSSGVDTSVVSTILKVLDRKKLVKRKVDSDNRKKNIKLTSEAISLLNKIIPVIKNIEDIFFSKLGNEQINFFNSLRLILAKKIRIKAERN